MSNIFWSVGKYRKWTYGIYYDKYRKCRLSRMAWIIRRKYMTCECVIKRVDGVKQEMSMIVFEQTWAVLVAICLPIIKVTFINANTLLYCLCNWLHSNCFLPVKVLVCLCNCVFYCIFSKHWWSKFCSEVAVKYRETYMHLYNTCVYVM